MVHLNYDWIGRKLDRMQDFECILFEMKYAEKQTKNLVTYKGEVCRTSDWVKKRAGGGRFHLTIQDPKIIRNGNGFRIRVNVFAHADARPHSYEGSQGPLARELVDLNQRLRVIGIELCYKDRRSAHWTIKLTNETQYHSLLAHFVRNWQLLRVGKYERRTGGRKLVLRLVKQGRYVHASLVAVKKRGERDFLVHISPQEIQQVIKEIREVDPACKIYPLYLNEDIS